MNDPRLSYTSPTKGEVGRGGVIALGGLAEQEVREGCCNCARRPRRAVPNGRVRSVCYPVDRQPSTVNRLMLRALGSLRSLGKVPFCSFSQFPFCPFLPFLLFLPFLPFLLFLPFLAHQADPTIPARQKKRWAHQCGAPIFFISVVTTYLTFL